MPSANSRTGKGVIIVHRGMRGLAQEVSKPQDAGKTVRRLVTYFRPFRASVAAAALLIVVGTLLQLLSPYLIGIAVDRFIAGTGSEAPRWLGLALSQGSDRTAGLNVTMLVLLGTYLLNWAASAGQFYLMAATGQKVLLRMRTQVFDHILNLSVSFLDEHEAGDLMSRLVNDTEVISKMFGWGIARIASLSLALVGIVVSMLALNWRLALASFTILPVMIMTTTVFSRRARIAFRRTRRTIGKVSAELQEDIAGVREVQAYAREDESAAEFRQVNAANRDANVQAQSIMSAFSPALDVLSTVSLAAVIGYGGYLALAVDPPLVTVGIIVSFLTYVRRFYHPIQMVAALCAQLQSAVAGAERIFELLDTQPEITDAPNAFPMPAIYGHVEFDGVTFAYGGEAVLKSISFEAKPGQMIALVGPTGVGKTTIVRLLSRFYDVDEGAVRIDGHDVRNVIRESFRDQMGIVLQDTFLFSGTAMQNIRYGCLDASDEKVIAAARLANADQFIQRLPEGYQTPLGERGHSLSQGQRQLMAIARAVLADPRLLILDEATSSVDTRTERLIQAALDELLKGRTSFVIAHRLSTIRNADQVLVLDEGRIVERGTHDELLAAGGSYYELYSSQFRRQVAPA